LLEGGVAFANDEHFPASGLQGNAVHVPTLGISVGLSSIAEFQIDGGFYHRVSISNRDPLAPLASAVTSTGTTTHDVEDVVVATKIRLLAEKDRRPAFGLRFATKLPNASNESGLGLDTTDFFMSVLAAKTVQSIRVVTNLGFGILSEPTLATSQNDVLTYGFSAARATTQQAEVVAEVNGRVSTRSSAPAPGTETRSTVTVGARYTRGPVRFDAGIFVGLTAVDPNVGLNAGFTYVFDAFKVP
jgi:hypothetical protein